MTMIRRRYYGGWLLRLAVFWIASALAITSFTLHPASAQATDGSWAAPLNLSHSGVATDPAILVDSDLVVHGVWQDTFGNFVYARLEGDQWTLPKATDLHFVFGSPATQTASGDADALLYTGPNPRFMAGTGSYSLAFWV